MRSQPKENIDFMEFLDRSAKISPIGVHVVDLNTYEMYYCNEAGFRLLDKEPCEFQGRICYEVLFDRSTPCENCRLQRTLEGEPRHEAYVSELDKVFLTSAEITTMEGKAVYVEYITDVSQEKKREKRRQIIYQQQIEALEDMDDENLIGKGSINLTKDHVIFYKNKKKWGVEVDSSMTFSQVVAYLVANAAEEEAAEELAHLLNRERLIQDNSKGKREGGMEYKRVQKDGNLVWVSLKYFMSEDPDSGDVTMFMYTHDISERKLESQIINRLAFLEYDALSIMDVKTHQFTLRSVNKKIEGPIYNRTGIYEEMLEARIAAVVHPSEQKRVLSEFAFDSIIKGLEKSERYNVTYTVVDDAQQLRRKRYCFSYLDTEHTTILYYRDDITEIYNREQEQLLQTEQALEVAKQASQEKTEFFSRMSHDMRTPMNGILGLTSLSMEEDDPAVLKENIKKIHNAGQYLLGLINDSLDFQKIESGKLTLNSNLTTGKELLDGVICVIEKEAKEKNITFEVENRGVDMEVSIKVDSLRIKQIFINLLANALKFTPEGGKVTFLTECVYREGAIAHNRFSVKDTGIGMSKEFLENGLFQPFHQEQNFLTSVYAGTGLGLSIVKKLVDLMHGTITVESEQGVGTTFVVELDIERVAQSDMEHFRDVDDDHKKKSMEQLAGKRILLAEDHPLNAEITMKLLEKVGCIVDWAENGAECVKKFQESKDREYDFILMDIRMPMMDGLEATKEIRRFPRADARQIPIVAMTANAYAEDVEKSMAAGMNGHLAKPIEPMSMYETMAIFISQRDKEDTL